MLYSRPMLLPQYWLQQQQQQQQFNGSLSGTTRVGRYQKKHSPAHTHPGQRTSFITFLHLKRSMASSLFSLRAWQSSRTTSLQVLFRLPLGLGPSTSYSMHFFTRSSSSFAAHAHTNTACFAAIPILRHLYLVSLSSLLGSLSFNLTPHIHLTILISARCSATTFSFLSLADNNTKKYNMLTFFVFYRRYQTLGPFNVRLQNQRHNQLRLQINRQLVNKVMYYAINIYIDTPKFSAQHFLTTLNTSIYAIS